MVTKNFFSTSKSSIKQIAIGGFDGVHYAHQSLINRLINGAVVVIESSYANLTPHTTRAEYITIPIIFFKLEDIKNLSGKEFTQKLQNIFPSLEKIIVGYDFHFGKNRASSAYDLQKIFDGDVEIVGEIKLDNISVHSKIIRQHLINGDIEVATKLLKHPYKIKGTHIKGQGIGKSEFVPTINIEIKDYLLPKEGVYISKSLIDNKLYNSITFFGHRVTTDGSFAVETYILDNNFNQDVDSIEIELYSRVRDNQKFDTYQDLKNAIQKDIKDAREYFEIE